MNRLLRTMIISFSVVGVAIVLGVALLASANVLAERQVKALAIQCHSHDEQHPHNEVHLDNEINIPSVSLGWLDFLMPSTLNAQDNAPCYVIYKFEKALGPKHTHCYDDEGEDCYTHRDTYVILVKKTICP